MAHTSSAFVSRCDRRRCSSLLIVLLTLFSASSPALSETTPNSHQIDLTQQQLSVRSQFPLNDQSTLVFRRSADSHCEPGRADILSLQITDQNDNTLEWQAMDTGAIDVTVPADVEQVTLQYQLSVNPSAKTRFDRDFAVLDLQDWLMLPDAAVNDRHQVGLTLPNAWLHSVSALERIEQHRFTAQHRQQLWQAPILAGNMLRYRFDVDGQAYELINLPDTDLWDGEMAMADLQRLLHIHHGQFGQRFAPPSRYMIINLFDQQTGVDSWGGAALLHGSVWSQRDGDQYQSWLHDVSRGLLQSHLPAIRPSSASAGLVEYYAALLKRRAGLFDHHQYLDKLAKSLRASPQQTLLLPGTDCSVNSGADVAGILRLDANIRDHSEGVHSLDNLLNQPSRHGVLPGPVSLSQYLNHIGEPSVMTEWLRGQPGNNMTLEQALHRLGLALRRPIGQPRAWLGMPVQSQNSRLTVGNAQAIDALGELQTGDEIIAIDGYRVGPGDWTRRLAFYEPGDEITLLFARRGEIRQITVTLAPRPSDHWRLTPLDDESAGERLNAWLDPT